MCKCVEEVFVEHSFVLRWWRTAWRTYWACSSITRRWAVTRRYTRRPPRRSAALPKRWLLRPCRGIRWISGVNIYIRWYSDAISTPVYCTVESLREGEDGEVVVESTWRCEVNFRTGREGGFLFLGNFLLNGDYSWLIVSLLSFASKIFSGQDSLGFSLWEESDRKVLLRLWWQWIDQARESDWLQLSINLVMVTNCSLVKMYAL